MAIINAKPEQMVDAQIEFTNDICENMEEYGVKIDSLDFLDVLARLGLELHPISTMYEASTSKAYFKELKSRMKS